MTPTSLRNFLFGMVLPAWAALHAQTSLNENSFALPSAPLICEAVSPDSTGDSLGAVEFQFDEDAADGRTFNVGYDSAGTPQGLIIVASRATTPGTAIAEISMVRFDQKGTGVGFRVWKPEESSSPNGAPASPKQEILTQDQLASAKHLALWLWVRRCNKPPPSQ